MPLHGAPRRFGEPPPQRRVLEDRRDPRRERFGGPIPDEEPVLPVPYEVAQVSHVRNDGGKPGRHRLHERQGEPLRRRGQREDLRPPEDRGNVVPLPGELHGVPQPERPRRRLQLPAQGAVADDHGPDSRDPLPDQRKRPEEEVDPLDRHEAADENDVPRCTGVGGASARRVDAARDHPDVARHAVPPEELPRAGAHRADQGEPGARPQESGLHAGVRRRELPEEPVLAQHASPLDLGRSADAEIDRPRPACPGDQRRGQAVQEQVEPAHRVRPRPEGDPEEREETGRDLPEQPGKARPGHDRLDLVERRHREMGHDADPAAPPGKGQRLQVGADPVSRMEGPRKEDIGPVVPHVPFPGSEKGRQRHQHRVRPEQRARRKGDGGALHVPGIRRGTHGADTDRFPVSSGGFRRRPATSAPSMNSRVLSGSRT